MFLADVVNDQGAKMGDRLEAARIRLERGWGKAPVMVQTDGEAPKFFLMSAFAVQPGDDTTGAPLAAPLIKQAF